MAKTTLKINKDFTIQLPKEIIDRLELGENSSLKIRSCEPNKIIFEKV